MRRTPLEDRGGGGGSARDHSFYYIASGRGEADAQLFMPVSRPIERIGHIRTYLPRIRRVCYANGCVGERTSCERAHVAYRTLSSVHAALFSSVLLLFVSSFGLRLLMARPRSDTPKCQPRDNDEARTSSAPPLLSPACSIIAVSSSPMRTSTSTLSRVTSIDAVGYCAGNGITTRFATRDRAIVIGVGAWYAMLTTQVCDLFHLE